VSEEGRDWFALLNGNRVGPLDRRALVAMTKCGMLKYGDFVWRPDRQVWTAAEYVPDLFSAPTPSMAVAELLKRPAFHDDQAAPAARNGLESRQHPELNSGPNPNSSSMRLSCFLLHVVALAVALLLALVVLLVAQESYRLSR
jgi:GYF domain 2